MVLKPVRTFVKLVETARTIINSEASWETKYGLVFSDEIAGAIHKTGIEIDYVDPDTTYEEDVVAFVEAAERVAEDLKKVLADLPEETESEEILPSRQD